MNLKSFAAFGAALLLVSCGPQLRFTNSATQSRADIGDKKSVYTIAGQTFDVLNLKNGASTEYKTVGEGRVDYSQVADHGHGEHTHTGSIAHLGVAINAEKGKLYTVDISVPSNSSSMRVTSGAPLLAP